MPATLSLLNGEISLNNALENDDNVLHRLSYPDKRIAFYLHLLLNLDKVAAIVSHHLGLYVHQCRPADVREWIAGSFNVCIPVYIDHHSHEAGQRVLIRFPLPYKLGESEYAGNAEEKLRCEVATYIWLQENCPTVPIPQLWGFGFPNGYSFTVPENETTINRLMWGIGRFLTYIFGRPLSCRYIRNKCPHDLGTGYIIIDYIEESDGKMLLTIWEEKRHDSTRRANLFQDLSRIMLTLSRIPLPHIASFRLDDYGLLHLDNRPLTLRLQHLENEGIPTDIDRNQTCSTSESYTLDLLACHNNRMRCMPNSMKDEWDSRAQLASITMMRALFPHFLRCDLRNGPFSLIFTDLNQPNILVDDDWHVKCLIGLEWACFLPIEMHEEFLHYFGEQESKLPFVNGTTSYFTQIMKKGWDMGNFFYLQALVNPKGLYRIFLQNIQPRYARAHLEDEAFDRIVSAYWATDASEMVSKKLGDKTQHDNALRAEFDEGKEAKKRCDKLARFLETLPSPEDILPIPLLNRH